MSSVRLPFTLLLLLVVVGAALGCEENLKFLDVNLDVRVAEGLDRELEEVDLNITYVTDTGVTNGGADGDNVAFPKNASSAVFSLLALEEGSLVGRGATASIDLPIVDDGEVGSVDASLLLADLVPGLVASLPPDLGDGSCVASDEAGRVFVVGGAAANQTGYVFGDDFGVDGIVGSFSNVEGLGCSASGGAVVFAGGCAGGPVEGIVEIIAGRESTVTIDPPAVCGTFAAKSKQNYWSIGPDGIRLYSRGGTLIDSAVRVLDVVAVESAVDGSVLVRERNSTGLLFTPGNLENPVISDGVLAIGRRLDDVMMLTNDGRLLQQQTEGFGQTRADVDVGAASAFTVLADDTVVAIVGNTLVVSVPGAANRTLALPRPRTHVSALPGDTVILSGGAGVDGVSLR